MTGNQQKLTPMMQQYFEIKSRYPDKDTILFFRLGDFYEMFFEDAEIASGILDIALTTRNKNDENPVPLCGVPFHSADGYITKLLSNGKKIAICEQVEDPSLAKGIVKRDVVKVITPGILTESDNLESKKHNYLVAVSRFNKKWGMAAVDVSTSSFKVTDFSTIKSLSDELSRIEPSEIIISNENEEFEKIITSEVCLKGSFITRLDETLFDSSALLNKLSEKEIDIIPDAAKGAAGAIFNYIEYANRDLFNNLKKIELFDRSKFMIIDDSTKRNLELTQTMIEARRYGSLLWLLDKTISPMGARMLREWLLHPLTEPDLINQRLDSVDMLLNEVGIFEKISTYLSGISDIERIAGRIAIGSVNAREMVSLRNSLNNLPNIIRLKKDFELKGDLNETLNKLDALEDIVEIIEESIVDDPPLALREGGIIKEGFSKELDELRDISCSGKNFIATLEEEERQKTNIPTLKVGYNRVFGYYIEVTNKHKERVPADYIRKQTLTNSERYITDKLKEFEDKVLGAEEKIKNLEYKIFSDLRKKLLSYVERIKLTAESVAKIDAFRSLAQIARENRFERPEVNDSSEISIKEGRHPIIEKLDHSERFIPNDIHLNNGSDRLLIITGPNMAGKSTVMRQVGLIVLMAQIGSFVPAKSAKIGIVDRIFTRVGASDNIMRGQSTFMVEMQEAASILSEATERSLIIIDEIGRGTSTFDGVAIAWSVAEYIHDKIEAKTLFATHYHELTDLELTKEFVRNFSIAVKEWNDKIIFLHKLVPGGVNHSYGIQVAKLAGLPKRVVERAKEVLNNLEKEELDEIGMPRFAHTNNDRKNISDAQLTLFHKEKDNMIRMIKETDIDTLTPIEALNLIHRLKNEVEE